MFSKIINIGNKKNLIYYFSMIFGVLAFSMLIFVAYGKIKEHVDLQKNNGRTIVIIDAGHGGEDGGAVGVDGIIEKDINLSIAKMLQELLKTAGYEVIMTREKDHAIYDDDKVDARLREKKRSDLDNRLKIIKENSNGDNIFVSIHQNKFTDPKYFGAQLFYSKNNPNSQILAEHVMKSIVGLIQPENTRELKPSTKNIYLLENSEIPSVTVECGFLSNEQEAHKLKTKEYQEQMAFSIFCGLINYFKNK